MISLCLSSVRCQLSALNDFSKNGLIDFEIILQEGSLDDPLPKLLKPFCSIEQDGRHS